MRHKLPLNSRVILLLLALTGCTPQETSKASKPASPIPVAQVPPGKESSLMPLQIGNQWIYSVEVVKQTPGDISRARDDVTLRITALEPTEDGKKATVEIAIGKNTPERQQWLINSKGIHQLSMGAKQLTFTPPKPLVKFPIFSGQNLKWSGTGPNVKEEMAQLTLQLNTLAPQEIDTEQGRLSAIPITSSETWKSSSLSGTTNLLFWWVPGIGLARLRQTETIDGKVIAEQRWSLKNYTLKQN
jgi:hypothetical protein